MICIILCVLFYYLGFLSGLTQLFYKYLFVLTPYWICKLSLSGIAIVLLVVSQPLLCLISKLEHRRKLYGGTRSH